MCELLESKRLGWHDANDAIEEGAESMMHITKLRFLLAEIYKERNAAVKAVDNRDEEALKKEMLKIQMDLDNIMREIA